MAVQRPHIERLGETARRFELAGGHCGEFIEAVVIEKVFGNPPLQVRGHGLHGFLQTSGNIPFSLTIPPFCPPIPSAHVLHAFFDRSAWYIRRTPPVARACLKV